MTTRCAPACSQALPVKPQGVWARGIEAWSRSCDLRKLEFRRLGSSGPSSLMKTIKSLNEIPLVYNHLAYGFTTQTQTVINSLASWESNLFLKHVLQFKTWTKIKRKKKIVPIKFVQNIVSDMFTGNICYFTTLNICYCATLNTWYCTTLGKGSHVIAPTYGSGHGTVAVLLPGFAINW